MRFLIDAQLPPRLARQLSERGHHAEHVNAIGLGGTSDARICSYAERTGTIIISKDGDFAELSRRASPSVQVVWIGLGNTRNAALWRTLAPHLAEIEAALASGERLIEIA